MGCGGVQVSLLILSVGRSIAGSFKMRINPLAIEALDRCLRFFSRPNRRVKERTSAQDAVGGERKNELSVRGILSEREEGVMRAKMSDTAVLWVEGHRKGFRHGPTEEGSRQHIICDDEMSERAIMLRQISPFARLADAKTKLPVVARRPVQRRRSSERSPGPPLQPARSH